MGRYVLLTFDTRLGGFVGPSGSILTALLQTVRRTHGFRLAMITAKKRAKLNPAAIATDHRNNKLLTFSVKVYHLIPLSMLALPQNVCKRWNS
jgi:hypothetical protein